MGVTVIPLETIYPEPNDDAVSLAADAQRATEAVLEFAPAPTTFSKS